MSWAHGETDSVRRKAFSLIEILVVVTIVIVMLAILFPVFSRSKFAAYKSVGIANTRQVALALIMYSVDHDDLYPRDDGCVVNSSLNPALNDSVPKCTGPTGFGHRINHFSWQKWIHSYVRNVGIYQNPLRAIDKKNWDDHGQIAYGIVLNTGLTGSLDTYLRLPGFPRQFRNAWLGGSPTAVPDSGQAMVLLEVPMLRQANLPGATVDSEGIGPAMTAYPIAVREYWRWRLMEGDVNDCVNRTKGLRADATKMPAEGIIVGFVDGHARFISAGEFLAKTPSKSEYLGANPNSPTSGWTFPSGIECNFTFSVGNYGFDTTPNTKIDYPLWALGRQP